MDKRYIGTIDNNRFFVEAEGDTVEGILHHTNGDEIALFFINANNNNGGTFYFKVRSSQQDYTVAEVARLFEQNKSVILAKVLEKTLI